MKILFISHRIPYPPNKGDKLRAFNIIKHLAQKHEISLACMVESREELKYVADLKPYCKQIYGEYISPFKCRLNYVRYLFSNYPLTMAHFYSVRFKQHIARLIAQNKYDLLYIYSAAMSQYVLDIDRIPKLLDLVDADCQKWLSYAEYAHFPMSSVYRLEGERTRGYERAVCPKFSACTLVSTVEKQILEQFMPGGNLHVVPNGINQEPYLPYLKRKEPATPNLLFVGGMFYFAYIDGIMHFYEHAFGHIKKAFPEVKFYIVGADPAPKVLKLNQDPNVCVTGYVEEVLPYLEQAMVYVVPLRMAPGIQNKILEAMAMNIPVVSSTAAVAGIDAKCGRDLLVADEPKAFAQAVIRLLNNPQLRQELAQNARRLITEKYDWQKNLKKLDQILEGISDTN
jgi:sugar transferase (PEP-CTERM/EpsH1 system associated)